jgi:hypothetical protein
MEFLWVGDVLPSEGSPVRGVRWPFIYSFLLALSIFSIANADPGNAAPIMPHQKDPTVQREFINAYASINQRPAIVSGAGAPTMGPGKVGNVYIDTTNGKVYISTGSTNSGNWVKLN